MNIPDVAFDVLSDRKFDFELIQTIIDTIHEFESVFF